MLVSKETQENSILFNPCIKTSEVLLPTLTDWFTNLKGKVADDKESV
jgi:membrane protein required for colicin V production